MQLRSFLSLLSFRSFLSFLSALLLGFGVAAQASTIAAGTYNLQNAFVGGYAVTGTVTVNSAGAAASANLTFNDAAFDNPGLPVFSVISTTSVYNGLSQNYLTTSSNGGQIALYFNTTADASGYFDLCLSATQCGSAAGTVDPSTLQIYGFYNSVTATSNAGMDATNFSGGYLTSASSPAVAYTPEPASFVMLGTGMFGVLGATRRGHLRA